MADKKKKVMKFRPPWAPNTEYEISVDDLSEDAIKDLMSTTSVTPADAANDAQDFAEVQGDAPKSPQFEEGMGPNDIANQGQPAAPPVLSPATPSSNSETIYKDDGVYRNGKKLSPEDIEKLKKDQPKVDQKHRRDTEAKKLGAADFDSLNEKQKALVMEHLGDASVSDYPSFGQLAGAAVEGFKRNPFLGPLGPALGVMDQFMTPTRAETTQQLVKRVPDALAEIPGDIAGAVGSLGLMPNLQGQLNQPPAAAPPQASQQAPKVAGDAPPLPTDIPFREPGIGAPAETAPQEAPVDTSRIDQELEGKKKLMDMERMLAQDEAKGKIEQNKIKMDEMQRMQAVQERIDNQLQGLRNSYEQTIQQINDPSMKVNPNRYWEEKSTGSKIAAAIGLFFSGLGGNGEAALQTIDRAIQRDIQAQQANINSKRQGLTAQAQGQLNLMNMFREKGQDEYNQIKLSTAAAYDGVERKLEALKGQVGDQKMAGELDLAIAGAKEKKEKAIMAAREHTSRLEHQAAQTDALRAQAAQDRAKAFADKKSPPSALKAMQEVQQLEGGLNMILNQEDAFKKTATGPLPQQANSLTKALDFTGQSATRKYESTKVPAAYTIHRSLEPGSRGMTDKDLEATVTQVLPDASNPTGGHMFARLRKDAVTKLVNYLNDAKRLGYDTSEQEKRMMPMLREAMKRIREDEK